jgi:dTDP-4-dehydrorhamnose 3,5-epimerase
LTQSPIEPTSIDGVGVVQLHPIEDERGFFVRTLDVGWFRELGWFRDHDGLTDHGSFVQHNQSRSVHGVLRGLHVRIGSGESKMIRCARGGVVDHVVDTRPWSPTFGRSERFVLDDITHRHLLLPPFVAHGFQVVSEVADISYLHSQPYVPDADIAIAWNDPVLGLEWPVMPPLVSARDQAAPPFGDVDFAALFTRA